MTEQIKSFVMHKSLTEALVAFQAELPDVSKGGTNPAFKSRYATLPDITKAVFPVASKHGLAFIAYPDETEHGPVLRYELRHVSGESIVGAFGLPDGANAQEYGKWMTYFRRYVLSGLTGITPDEDDDGNGAQTPRHRRDPQQATRVARAATALTGAKTLEAVEKVWADIQKSGLGEALAGAHAERVAALTPSPSTTDEWAPVAEVKP